MEVALQPVADRLVPQHTRPAGAQHHRHLAGRRIDRLQVHQRLADRLVGLVLPVLGQEDVAVGRAAAAAGAAGFHAAAVGADHADIDADQRPHVGGAPAAGADDLDDLPGARQRHRDLARLGFLGAHIGVDLLQQRHLLGEGHAVDRIVVGIEQAVGAARRFVGLAAAAGAHRLDRFGGALQRLLVQRRGVGKARDVARHRAQAEALRGVERGALQLAVVERQAFALDIFQEQLAVVAAGQRVVDHLRRLALVECALAEEQAVGGGEMVDRLAHGRTPEWASGKRLRRRGRSFQNGRSPSCAQAPRPPRREGRSCRSAG